MKKICFLLILFFIAIIMASNKQMLTSTFLTPQATLQKEEGKMEDFIELNKQAQEKDYEKAFDKLISSSCDTFLLNKNLVEHIMDKYKKILTIKATAYLKDNQPDKAYSILKNGQSYFLEDASYQALYQNANYQNKKIDWVKYTGTISHLSLFPLITKPKVNIGDATSLATTAHEEYLTPTEFLNILTALYNNNYILVDIYDVYSVTNKTVAKKELYLPEGKKALLLTFEDLCYTKAQKSKGSVDKLILDREHRLASFTSKKAIQDRVSSEEECIPILEHFIATHPDFSHNGARAIITLSGEEGILGYRTQKSNANSRYDIKKALEVVTKLKNLGYRFACSGYSHNSIAAMNTLERNKDLYNWQEEVGKIVGVTPIYYLSHNDIALSKEVLQCLQEYGYSLVIGAIDTPDTHLPRQFLCGRTLLDNADTFEQFFDANKVYDKESRQG